MQIFDENKNRIGTLTGFKERSITTTLDSGDKEMSFQYHATGEKVDALKPECYLRTKTDEFVLKQIDESDDFNTYTATLNVEELESKVFTTGFEMIEKTIRECLENAFAGTGWSIRNCEITKRRTIRETDQQTGWTILQKALSTYRCECIIDTLQKAIDIYDRIGEDKGAYFIEGLNLKKVTRKSDTYDFYTRIYPIGKDGLTPETVLGKDYIDNHQYSNKVKACVWKDERYTVVQSLIEDAEAKLEEISKPYKQYTAEVQDLAKQSDIYKNILDYGIGDTVTLISKQKGIKDKQRIVKIVEYPESPEKNTVELSNVNKTFAEIQQEEVDAETDRATAEEDNLSKDITNITVRVDKNEDSIEAEVADRTRENLELGTKISQTAHKVSVAATGGDKYVGITIQLYDENGNLIDTTSGAANITITGFVTFNDLANAGSTTINGANITTGEISCDRLKGGTINGQRFFQTGKYGDLVIDNGIIFVPDTGGILIGQDEVATRDWVYDSAVANAARTAQEAEHAAKAGEASHSTVATNAEYLKGSSAYVTMSGNDNFIPSSNSVWCGTTPNPFAGGYSKGGWKTTSDRRKKKDFSSLLNDARYENFFKQLRPMEYRFVDDSNGIHIGFVAQDVEEALIASGIGNDELFALEHSYFTRYDFGSDEEWNNFLISNNGASDIYVLCYQEFIALNTAMIQKQMIDMEFIKCDNFVLHGEITILNQRVQELEEKLC